MRRKTPGRGRHGFALVLTLALLALLVLLLVSLASLTRMDTMGVAQAHNQALARQHALLAVDLALGQLQKQLGPDQRVTATARAWAATNRYYTGVWDTTRPDPMPTTWLVSGNEGTNGLAVAPTTEIADGIELAGVQTTGTRNAIVAPAQPIRADGLPGLEGAAIIGNYAWWVGDQGVKAAVAVRTAPLDTINYVPYDTVELRNRIRQQIAFEAGPVEFEPRDPANRAILPVVPAFNQLALLKRADGTPVGWPSIIQHFSCWSPGNYAVLANSRTGGLRQDLSLQPSLLGDAFAAWADYRTYMEDPAAGKMPPPKPDIATSESLRRRYRITRSTTGQGISAAVAPVLALCLLNFDSRTLNGATGVAPIESRLRWIIGLWNPFTSALVPEDLRLEISGLPSAVEFTPSFDGPALAGFSLAGLFGSPFRISLAWNSARADLQGQPDVSSWLPGRVYYWTSLANTSEPPGGNAGYFYSKSLIGSPSRVVSRVAAATVSGNAVGGWRVKSETVLTVRLYRAGDSAPLATYTSPVFPPFFAADAVTTPRASSGSYEFSFFFRLDQNRPGESVWLTTAQRDPRGAVLAGEAFVGGSQGPQPSAYPGVPAITNDDLLLERAMADYGQSHNEDVPVFELPRSPVLSVGQLQHLSLVGERPFTIGNPWGKAGEWNALFDRYFFSGLANETALPDLAGGQCLPNPMLTILPRRRDGGAVTAADLKEEGAGGHAAFSSRYLLGQGAFNLNSVEPVPWAAVLRGTRYGPDDRFTWLDASEMTGTGADSPPQAITGPMSAAFFRFGQSAGEVFKAHAGKAGGLAGGFNPSPSTVANTHHFRRGLRVLTEEEVVRLAAALSVRIEGRLRQLGAFHSTQEFLDEGMLEKAITDAQLNGAVTELSSQYLTQADVMTALAPLLFPRSDTFLIRAYGDAVNPVTGAREGRAWCEAIAQRLPEYLDPTQPEETLLAGLNATNARFGRRFKIVSFRWLTAFDL